jgi:polysaccharide biosynthesis protein PslH
MTPSSVPSRPNSALFLSPEPPLPGSGGGGLRSASLLEYLRQHYSVEVAGFILRPHSKSLPAKLLRNSLRLLRGVPPLFDRYSGYADQLAARLGNRQFDLAVIEHFWCAAYAPLLRRHCRTLVLDLHNIESDLAETHARAARWPASWASAHFASAYRDLERQWLPQFDIVLVPSADDARRIQHPRIIVYPNALPEIPCPNVGEENCIVFSGNLEYHPNIQAVRWFRAEIWPRIRASSPDLEWRLIGRNPEAVARWTSGDPRIRVIGPVADAVAEIARAKVAVVPLLSGSGTRFKILEAWAAQRAVVSTAQGAAGLSAIDGQHLLLRESPQSLADAVVALLEDSSRRSSLGHAGRQLYLDRFTWPAAWSELEKGDIRKV